MSDEIFNKRLTEIEFKLEELNKENRDLELKKKGLEQELVELTTEKLKIEKYLNPEKIDKIEEVVEKEPEKEDVEVSNTPKPLSSLLPEIPIPEKDFNFKKPQKTIKPLTKEQIQKVTQQKSFEFERPQSKYYIPKAEKGQDQKLMPRIHKPLQPPTPNPKYTQPIIQHPIYQDQTFFQKYQKYAPWFILILTVIAMYYFMSQ